MSNKRILLNYLKQVNADELKNYLIGMVSAYYDEDFVAGHDNGYDDGNGELKDIYVKNLMFDCRIK
jgi:hypothetical protein